MCSVEVLWTPVLKYLVSPSISLDGGGSASTGEGPRVGEETGCQSGSCCLPCWVLLGSCLLQDKTGVQACSRVWEESRGRCARGIHSPVCGRIGSLPSCGPIHIRKHWNRGFRITYDGSYHRNKRKAGQDNSASCFLCGNKKLLVYDLISFKMQK